MGMNSIRIRDSISAFNNTTRYSKTFDMTNHLNIGVQVVLAGSSIQGTVTLEHSSDGSNWGSFATGTAFSAAGSVFIGGSFSHNFARVAVTSTDTDNVTAEIYGVGKNP